MTLDQMIERLTELRQRSKLAGDTMVYICTPYRDHTPIAACELDPDDDGIIALIFASPEPD